MTHYVCRECGAEDADHQDYTDPPKALICYNCKSGTQAKSTMEMLVHGIGMHPIQEENE